MKTDSTTLLSDNSNFIRLTALWAFVEAGLGSILHAFHLPFTGLILGGFSVIIISLFALKEPNVFKKILKATIIVICVKAIANPATSPFAYIAVAFQGIVGACIYRLSAYKIWSHLAFAVISMLESAVQKLLILLLFFGNTLRQSTDALVESISRTLHYNGSTNGSALVAILYCTLFAIWGLILGVFMHKLPVELEARKFLYLELNHKDIDEAIAPKGKLFLLVKVPKISIILVIIILLLSYILQSSNPIYSAFIFFLRTILILLIWQMLILPLWSKKMQNWANNKMANNSNFNAVQMQINIVSNQSKALYKHLRNKHKGINFWKEYMLGLIVLSLHK